MKVRRGRAIIGSMIDLEEFVSCEHGYEPQECPVCARVDADAPCTAEAARVEAETRVEVPLELAGVPFS
ncbi:MAG TPA: hypothetical protein VFA56_13270 [Gaiellaceae bacterium]|nr:hypothetical protein [Gaiellaceae bacterium]